jgi:hypothetical protein
MRLGWGARMCVAPALHVDGDPFWGLAMNIPFFSGFIDEAGNVRPSDAMTRAADGMLGELVRITALLRPQAAEVADPTVVAG